MSIRKASVVELNIEVLNEDGSRQEDELVRQIQTGYHQLPQVSRAESSNTEYVQSSVRRSRWQHSRNEGGGATNTTTGPSSPSSPLGSTTRRGGGPRSINMRDQVKIRTSGVRQRAVTASQILESEGELNRIDFDGPPMFLVDADERSLIQPDNLKRVLSTPFNSPAMTYDQACSPSPIQHLHLEDIASSIKSLQKGGGHQQQDNHASTSNVDKSSGGGGNSMEEGGVRVGVHSRGGMSSMSSPARPVSRMETDNKFHRFVTEALDRDNQAYTKRQTDLEAERQRSRSYGPLPPAPHQQKAKAAAAAAAAAQQQQQSSSTTVVPPGGTPAVSPAEVPPTSTLLDTVVLENNKDGGGDGVGRAAGGSGVRSSVRRGNPEHDTNVRLYQTIIRGGSRIASQSRPTSCCGALVDPKGTPLAALHPLTRSIRDRLLNTNRNRIGGNGCSVNTSSANYSATGGGGDEREDGLDETAEENVRTLPSRLLEAVFKPTEGFTIDEHLRTTSPLSSSQNNSLRHDRRMSQPDKAQADAFMRRSEDIQLASKKLAQKQQLRKGILGHVLALVNDNPDAKKEVRKRVQVDRVLRGHRAFSAEAIQVPAAVAAIMAEKRELLRSSISSPNTQQQHQSPLSARGGGDNSVESPDGSPKNFLAANAADARLEGHIRREERRLQLLEQDRHRGVQAEETRIEAEKERLEELDEQLGKRRGANLGRDRQWLALVTLISTAHSIHSFIAYQRQEIAFRAAAAKREEQQRLLQRSRFDLQSADSAERIRQLVATLSYSSIFQRAIGKWKYSRRVEATTIVVSLFRTIASNSKIQLQCRRLIEHIKVLQRVVRKFLKRLSYRRNLYTDYIDYFLTERAVFSRQLCLDFEKEVNKRKHRFAILPARAGPSGAVGTAPPLLSKGAVALDSSLQLVTSYATGMAKSASMAASRGVTKDASIGRGQTDPTPAAAKSQSDASPARSNNIVGTPRALATLAYRYILAVENYHSTRSETNDPHSHSTDENHASQPTDTTGLNNHVPPIAASPLLSKSPPTWSFILPSGTKGFMSSVSTSLSEIRRRKGLFPSDGAVLYGTEGGFYSPMFDDDGQVTTTRTNHPILSGRNGSLASHRSGGGGAVTFTSNNLPVIPASSRRLPQSARRVGGGTTASQSRTDFLNQVAIARQRVWLSFPPSPDLLFAASCLPSSLTRYWRNPFSGLFFAKETHNLPYSERLTTKLPTRIRDAIVRYFFAIETAIHKQRLHEWRIEYKAISAKIEWEKELSEFGVAATLAKPTSTTTHPKTTTIIKEGGGKRSGSSTPPVDDDDTEGGGLQAATSQVTPPVFDAQEALTRLLPSFPRRRCLPTENEARLIALIGYAMYYVEKRNFEEVTKVVTKKAGGIRTPEGRASLDVERQVIYGHTTALTNIHQQCQSQVRRLERTVPGLTDCFVSACAGSDDDDDDDDDIGADVSGRAE